MGQQQHTHSTALPTFLQNYRKTAVQSAISRPITYLLNHQNHEFAMLKVVLQSSQLPTLIQQIAKKRCIKSDYNVRLVNASACHEDSYCQQISQHYFLIDLPHRQLLEEFERRREMGKHFEEEEIWNIVVHVVFGMALFQKFGILHRSLTLDSIFVNKAGEVKVADPWMIGDLPLPTKYLQQPQPYYYLPPDWLQAGQQSYQDDVLSFGMTILSLGLLRHLQDHSPSIQMHLIPTLFKEFGQRYGKDLVALLRQMMLEKDRPDWITIQKAIRESQEELEMERYTSQQKVHQHKTLFQQQAQLISSKKQSRETDRLQKRPSNRPVQIPPKNTGQRQEVRLARQAKQARLAREARQRQASIVQQGLRQRQESLPRQKKQLITKVKGKNKEAGRKACHSLKSSMHYSTQVKEDIPVLNIMPIAVSPLDQLNPNPRQLPRQHNQLLSMLQPPHKPCPPKCQPNPTHSQSLSQQMSNFTQKMMEKDKARTRKFCQEGEHDGWERVKGEYVGCFRSNAKKRRYKQWDPPCRQKHAEIAPAPTTTNKNKNSINIDQ